MQWFMGKPRGRSLAEDNHLLRELLAKEHTQRLKAEHRAEELEQQLYSAAHAAEQLGESLCLYLAPEPLMPATCPGKLSLLPGSSVHDAPLSATVHVDALRPTADTSKQQLAAGSTSDALPAGRSTPGGPAAAHRQQRELQQKLKGLAAAWKQRLEAYDAGRLDQAEPLPTLAAAAAAARQREEQRAAAAGVLEGGASSSRSSGGGEAGRHHLLACAAAAACAPGVGVHEAGGEEEDVHSGISRRGGASPGPVRNLSQQLEEEGAATAAAAVAAAAAGARGPSLRSSDQDCYETYPRDTCGAPSRREPAGSGHPAPFQQHLQLNLQAGGGYGGLVAGSSQALLHSLQHAPGGAQQQRVVVEEDEEGEAGVCLEGRPLLGGSFRHASIGTSAALGRPHLPSFHGAAALAHQQPHPQQQQQQQQQQGGLQANWGGPAIPQALEDWQPLHNALRAHSSVASIHSMRSSMHCLGDTTPLELLLQHHHKQAALAAGAAQVTSRQPPPPQQQPYQQRGLVAQHSCTTVRPVAAATTQHSAAGVVRGSGGLEHPQMSMEEVPYYYLAPSATASAAAAPPAATSTAAVARGRGGAQEGPQPAAPAPAINDDTDCMLCNSSAGSTRSSSRGSSAMGHCAGV